MKPRKKNETDAHYISRLEMANDNLRRDNKSLSERMEMFTERARPAAQFAGAALNAAAEVCGMRDDQRVTSCAAALDALAGLPWTKELPKPDLLPEFMRADPAARGGDCEMIVASAFEDAGATFGHPLDWMSFPKGATDRDRRMLAAVFYRLSELARTHLVGQAREAMGLPERAPLKPPRVRTLAEARQVVADLWMQIGNTLSDLEMSRSCLRLDLRSAMYERVFMEIHEAINDGFRAVDHLPIPRGVDGKIPF